MTRHQPRMESLITSLTGKAVIVTGGTRGIGKGIAAVFVRAGARVCIVGRTERDGIAAVRDLSDGGGLVLFCRGDVRTEGDMKRAATRAASAFGGIDVLCANAGVFPRSKLTDMTVHDWDSMFATNLRGMFLSVRACLPYLKTSKAGRIILTSSITGPINGIAGAAHYGATKAGMLGFMRSAALELANSATTINAILPGNILTEGLLGLGRKYVDAMRDAIPLKRLGTAEDIGYAAAFLASDEAGFITGQTIVVDGGQTLPE